MLLAKRIAILAFVISLIVTAAAATETSIIKQRQEAMEGVGKAMKALGAIARKQAPFDAAVVKSSAEAIAEHLLEAAELFPEGSGSGEIETFAKAEIWSDRANFDKILQSTHAAAVAMQSVADEAAFGPALGTLGNGCKSCHDAYRRPKP